MDINELTIGQAKEIAATFGGMSTGNVQTENKRGLDDFIGMNVISRTYAAGVWFGRLAKKAGAEVILHSARRMWQWKCREGISLSELATSGIDAEGSRICAPVPMVWLEAIEIIPVLDTAVKSIQEAEYAKAR